MANAHVRVEVHPPSRQPNLIASWIPLKCFMNDSEETSPPHCTFAIPMKLERESVSALDMNNMDRRVIRVDLPPTHAGITAALRRAFESAATDPCDREFADLLRRLN
jgi:hypothetical protein